MPTSIRWGGERSSPELLSYDVDVSWWVTPEAYERGYYQKLYRALSRWAVEEFPFSAPFYSNVEVPGGAR